MQFPQRINPTTVISRRSFSSRCFLCFSKISSHFECITMDYSFIFFFSDIHGTRMMNPLTVTVVPTHGWRLWC